MPCPLIMGGVFFMVKVMNDYRLTSNNGFTLIEVMIVVAIIGILSAIAFPLYNGYVQSAREGVVQQNLDSLKLFLEDYWLDNSTYVAGTYGPDSTTLKTKLGWNPEGDDDQFLYTVESCGKTGGTIANCYKITVKHIESETTKVFTKDPP